MVNFSEGQFMGQPSPITDEDLATVALFLHRANSFQALLEREAGVLEKVTPREKGETGDGNEAGTRGYLTRVSSKSEFKEAIEKFEADEGPLWGRDTIAHTPISHGVNMGAYNNRPGYRPYVNKTRNYFKDKASAETVRGCPIHS